jgi:hypothetical protein
MQKTVKIFSDRIFTLCIFIGKVYLSVASERFLLTDTVMSQRIWAIVLLCLLLGAFAFSMFLIKNDKHKLSRCSVYTKALLERVYSEPRKGYSVVYSFKVNGTVWQQNEGLDDNIDLEDLIPGDSISIQYACDDYTVSRITGK